MSAEESPRLFKDWQPSKLDVKSGWKNNSKVLAEIVTAINNEIHVKDESVEMEKVDIVLEWIKTHVAASKPKHPTDEEVEKMAEGIIANMPVDVVVTQPDKFTFSDSEVDYLLKEMHRQAHKSALQSQLSDPVDGDWKEKVKCTCDRNLKYCKHPSMCESDKL